MKLFAANSRAFWAIAWATALLAASVPARATPPPGERDFYAALDDTLGDFEFDLKHDAVKGADDIAVRDILVSENVPQSFTTHLEDLLDERMLRGTKTKVLQCLGCKSRRASMGPTRISVEGPRTDPKESLRVAKARGIKHYLDASFTYQPTGLLLSLTIVDPETNTIEWTHTYNSENSRAAMLRRGLDMDQLDPSTRKATEYPAIIQYRLRMDFLFEPDISTQSTCMGLTFQMVERYHNRKLELGFEAEYLQNLATLLPNSTVTSLYTPVNFTMLLVHAYNFIGSEEDYNLPRGSLNAGLGGTYSNGFLGPLIRVGFEWREARHFATSLILGYRVSSTEFLPTSTGVSISGFEYGLGASYLF